MQQFNSKSGPVIQNSSQNDHYAPFITIRERKVLRMIFTRHRALMTMFLKALYQAYFIVGQLH